jgi:crotonobetainyl-CoA:carnitine CoA-transferase CaiB-like acyl-CoA transferase
LRPIPAVGAPSGRVADREHPIPTVGDTVRAAGPPPTPGQHNEQVQANVLGYDEDRITELAIAEALE